MERRRASVDSTVPLWRRTSGRKVKFEPIALFFSLLLSTCVSISFCSLTPFPRVLPTTQLLPVLHRSPAPDTQMKKERSNIFAPSGWLPFYLSITHNPIPLSLSLSGSPSRSPSRSISYLISSPVLISILSGLLWVLLLDQAHVFFFVSRFFCWVSLRTVVIVWKSELCDGVLGTLYEKLKNVRTRGRESYFEKETQIFSDI